MHQKYIQGQHPSNAVVPRPPFSWRRLEEVRNFAEGQIRWCLGRGFVDFWHDRWLGDETLADLLGLVNPPHMLVTEFIDQDE